jgi:hypothetical protein
MEARDWLAELFEEHRTRLRAVAYRAKPEDAVAS